MTLHAPLILLRKIIAKESEFYPHDYRATVNLSVSRPFYMLTITRVQCLESQTSALQQVFPLSNKNKFLFVTYGSVLLWVAVTILPETLCSCYTYFNTVLLEGAKYFIFFQP